MGKKEKGLKKKGNEKMRVKKSRQSKAKDSKRQTRLYLIFSHPHMKCPHMHMYWAKERKRAQPRFSVPRASPFLYPFSKRSPS